MYKQTSKTTNHLTVLTEHVGQHQQQITANVEILKSLTNRLQTFNNPPPRSWLDMHHVCQCPNDLLFDARLRRCAWGRLCGIDDGVLGRIGRGLGGRTPGLDPTFPHPSELEFWKHPARCGRHGLGPSHGGNRGGWLQRVGPCLWGGV